MKIATQVIDAATKEGKQLRTLQASINDTLARVEFDSVMRLTSVFYPENMPLTISVTSRAPVFGVTPVYLKNLTQDEIVPLYGVLVDWVGDGGGIKVRSIEGLIPGQLYEIRFIAYA